ncbi:gamma-aminobutyric acid type B receptor subunit 2-like [Diadema antillarum]|uniref:gamma-aminobutyric acid type B receptor subunit 2-like n=1 Tax=Diadema antillarum TaxID=105358 RepID=UPI003A88295D
MSLAHPGGDPIPTEVHMMAMYPGGSWIGLEIAGEIAVEEVNSHPDYLAGYTIVLHVNHTNPMTPTAPNPGLAANLFYENIYSGPPKPFLIGGFYSENCVILCDTSKHWNVIEISYGASSPALSDREECPYFYRTPQSAAQQNVPRVQLIQMYGWDRVAIIRFSNVLFTATMEDLRSLLLANNISIVANELFDEDPSYAMRYIKEKDARIIIGLFWEPQARKVFCEAYKLGMYGERYAWILRGVGYQDPEFLLREDTSISCDAQQLIDSSRGTIITNWVFISDYEGPTISGKNAQQYEALYSERAGSAYFSAHTFVYDAVWAVAAALNASIEPLAQLNKTIDNFNYEDSEMREVFMEKLDELDAYGMSGPLAFSNGDRLGRFVVEQIWGDGPPHDEIFLDSEMLTLPVSVYASIAGLSCLGIILAASVLAFNIAFRRQRAVKLSSPNINNLIILGGIMTFLAVILMGADENVVDLDRMDDICKARLWVLSLGFTLAFGAMFSKTFRVHKIFINKKLQKRSVKDIQLVAMVGGFVLIDVIYLLVWEIMKPLKAVTMRFESSAVASADRLIVPERLVCRREDVSSISWLSGIYIFKGILLLFGLFLAYETRAVKIRALNDAKYIGISVYNVFILSAVGALFNMVMDPEDFTLVYTVTGLCVVICATATLLVIFLPKVIDVVKNPDGPRVSTLPDEGSSNYTCHTTAPDRKKFTIKTLSAKVGDGESSMPPSAAMENSSRDAWN